MSLSTRLSRITRLVDIYVSQHLRSSRSLMLWPILLLFIVGSCWGLADPEISLPGEIKADTPFEVLFIASGFILLSATLGVVLVGFDGISRKRLSGVLSVEFSQPIPRSDLGISMLLGVWGTVLIPTTLLSLLGMVAIHEQMGAWPELGEAIVFLVATGLLLYWYAAIQLLVSSWANDMGGAIAWGIGTWMMFTMVWVLVTVLVAGILGVEVGDTSDSQYQQLSVWVDLFSPNGVYQMLLESNLDGGMGRRIDSIFVWMAALLWSIIPTWLFLHRFERIK